MKKKILALGPQYSIHTFKWLYPVKEKYDVTLFSFHPNEYEHPIEFTDKVQIIQLPRITKTKIDYFYMPFFLVFLIFTNNYSLIISQYASSYGLLGALFIPFKKKILIFWGSDLYKYKNGIFYHLIRWIAKQYDQIILPSNAMKADLLPFDLNKNKYHVFQYGVPWSDFHQLIQKSNTTKKYIQFLSIRKWEELYNIDLILEAFVKYSTKYPEDQLHMTVNSNTPYALELLKKYQSNNQIKLYNGLSFSELKNLISKSDILISIPKSDGMPISVLEATSAGCLPVLSNLPANKEILSNCEGILVKNNSIDEIVNSLKIARSKLVNFDKHKNSNSVRNIADQQIARKKLLDLIQNLIGE